MFKLSRKINLSHPPTFWRYVVIIFGCCLLLVFVGQTIFMFIIIEPDKEEVITIPTSATEENLNPKKVAEFLEELDVRPIRFEGISSTSTVFIDPSL
jgi:hypothetical protein